MVPINSKRVANAGQILCYWNPLCGIPCKTLVPIEKEVDRKAAAKAVGEKAVDMIHVKDITKITGYVRGGCSPIGMKKPFPTVFDASAGNFQEIYVSGGRIGLTLKVPVADLLKVTGGKLAAITAEE